ncbi:conjugal transfer protein TraB [Salmonella enterica subsp. enterica serovar Isangi]|nr:conjugal transfer protein TraB [Salmonella enterica subsp. enterica serovar Isangi]
MAGINTVVKRKQYLWLGIVVAGAVTVIAGGLYLSDAGMKEPGGTVAGQEPVPDMTGVVDTAFDDKVRQHATTEMQVTAAQLQKQYDEISRELDVLNKQRADDQRRIEKLGQDNAALAAQVNALGARPVTLTGGPVPTAPAFSPGPDGEPPPGNTPVNFPPQGTGTVPPPTTFYPGNGVTPPPQVTYQPVPVPDRILRKVFPLPRSKDQSPSLPYIPSGSFAKAMLVEGADANASVTGNESTVPMQLRITGPVEMPNSKTYDLSGCFVGLEAWGDVSSERAIVRTRNISCLKNGKTIDEPIKGHVSFRGKNGIKGEVVMRNGRILGWAWGAGFVDGIGQGGERASQPAVGLGATATYGAGDVLKSGLGGGTSKAAQTLSEYYIKRAEQYHPVIPVGAGNEVTVVFQDGFRLKTVDEMAPESSQGRTADERAGGSVPESSSFTESHMSGFNTDQMLKHLGSLNPQQFMSGSQGGHADGE